VNESDARAVLLVRAAEHERADLLSPEALDAARREAGPPNDLGPWLAARARALLAALPAELQRLARHELPPRALAHLLPAAALALGLASNLLGPAQRIHAVWNPVTLLLAWNLAVYLGALVLALRGRGDARRAERDAGARSGLGALSARLVARAPALGAGAASGALRARYLRDYAWTCRSPIAARTSRLLALSAVAFALGALGGVLLRGVAFEYRVAWSSTLVPDPAQRAVLAKAIFWPAALALGARFPDAGALRLAASESGAPAAIWIAVWAICVAAIVVLPRAAWIALAGRAARRRAREVAFDLSDPAWSRLALPPPSPPGGPLDPRVLGWFVLDAPACTALASFESALVLEDAASEEARPSLRARLTLRDHAERKRRWYGAWRDVVAAGFAALPEADRPRLLAPGDRALDDALARVRANANRFAAELVLLELAAFEAYWPLSAQPGSARAGSGARLGAGLAGAIGPMLGSAVRDTLLRRSARSLGLPEELGPALRAQLDRVGRELTRGPQRVALGVAAGAAVGLLSFGIAAPVVALVAGKALGAAGAAVAVKAGLAALGGGAVVAGGVGIAGRGGPGGAVVGGGALLGVGAAPSGSRPRPEALLLAAAKIEVFLRAIVVGRHDDRIAARDVLAQVRASAEAVRALAEGGGAEDGDALAKAADVLDTALRRNEAWARASGVLPAR
jgi:hypothetical protein